MFYSIYTLVAYETHAPRAAACLFVVYLELAETANSSDALNKLASGALCQEYQEVAQREHQMLRNDSRR